MLHPAPLTQILSSSPTILIAHYVGADDLDSHTLWLNVELVLRGHDKSIGLRTVRRSDGHPDCIGSCVAFLDSQGRFSWVGVPVSGTVGEGVLSLRGFNDSAYSPVRPAITTLSKLKRLIATGDLTYEFVGRIRVLSRFFSGTEESDLALSVEKNVITDESQVHPNFRIDCDKPPRVTLSDGIGHADLEVVWSSGPVPLVIRGKVVEAGDGDTFMTVWWVASPRYLCRREDLRKFVSDRSLGEPSILVQIKNGDVPLMLLRLGSSTHRSTARLNGGGESEYAVTSYEYSPLPGGRRRIVVRFPSKGPGNCEILISASTPWDPETVTAIDHRLLPNQDPFLQDLILGVVECEIDGRGRRPLCVKGAAMEFVEVFY